MTKKKIVISDVKSLNYYGHSIGHYFPLAQNYLDVYGDVCNIQIAGGPIYKTRFAIEKLFVLPYDVIEGGNSLKNKWYALMNCRFLLKKVDFQDAIVLQHSGASTAFLGIALFAKKRNKIYVIQYNTDALSSRLQRLIYKFAKEKIAGFICPDDRIGKAYGRPYCIVTDYIYSGVNNGSQSFQLQSSYNEKKYDFAIVGGIFPDKGVVEVAEHLRGTKYTVLIAGKADTIQSVKLKEIASLSSNIKLHLGFVSDKDYYRYINESRYCILNYRGVYSDRSSGVVLDILFNGSLVVGHRCNALQFIKDENVGYLFDDIFSFNPEIVLNETMYAKFQEGLKIFLQKQRVYRNKVIDFLGL